MSNIYLFKDWIYRYNINIMWITGEFQLPLNSVDLAGPVEEWKDLAAVDDGSNQYLGDLCLSLRYVPSSGKLTGIYKKDCWNLLQKLSILDKIIKIWFVYPNKCIFHSCRVGGSQIEEDGYHRCFGSIRKNQIVW